MLLLMCDGLVNKLLNQTTPQIEPGIRRGNFLPRSAIDPGAYTTPPTRVSPKLKNANLIELFAAFERK